MPSLGLRISFASTVGRFESIRGAHEEDGQKWGEWKVREKQRLDVLHIHHVCVREYATGEEELP